MVDSKPPEKRPKSWQEGVGIPAIRVSRAGMNYVEELLRSAWPPALEFREDHVTKATEIVIRFPGTSQELPDSIRDIYFRFGLTLPKAFEEILRTTLQQKMLRAELASLGYNAYREAWLHLVRTLYLDTSHDVANKRLRSQIQALEKNTRRGRRGKESEIDRNNLLTKYAELLSIAKRVHSAASVVVEQFKAVAARVPADEKMARIFTSIWEEVKDLYGTRVAHLIFSGEAFQLISAEDEQYANGNDRYLVRLERPGDWAPEDLAAALLAIEEGKKYKVIKGKSQKLTSKPTPIPQ